MLNEDFNRYLKKNDKIKFLLYFIKALIIICLILIIIIFLFNNNMMNMKKELNISMNNLTNFYEKKCGDVDFLYKLKYDSKINFYAQMLRLYNDDLPDFYIKGREFIMKSYGKFYNDSNITTIQDKLNWLLIHENLENKTNAADKILLHEYSKKILGKDICVPIIKIYNHSDEINFNELPEKFVLKCNHGSGMNIICNNKSILNITETLNTLNKWMNTNYGLQKFEYQYIKIKKKIFAEKYLCDNIKDYKIYCFNGQPKFIRVQQKLINQTGKLNNYYNLDWNLNEIETGLGPNFVRRPDIIIEKPKNLKLMIKYARKLSSSFSFVRVDLYEIENKIYLGELTFTPSNNIFNNKDYNQSLYLGDMLDIYNNSHILKKDY